MATASLIISLLAFVAAAGSALYAGRIWRIERNRDRQARRPAFRADDEDYDGRYPCFEITNDSEEDLVDVVIELRSPLQGYRSPVDSLRDSEGNPATRVSLGPMTAADRKRLPFTRNEESYGEVTLHAHCRGHDGVRWRVTVKRNSPARPSGLLASKDLRPTEMAQMDSPPSLSCQ